MIRSITQKKSEEEIDRLLNGFARIFIIGCGTCATLTRTGGEPEVQAMKKGLPGKGKIVTGHAVVPVACDNLTREFLSEFERQIEPADSLLIMACAYGVQTIARHFKKPVIPALDTLFIGKETGIGEFNEICSQCGTCLIGETGGICPVTACHKGLVNGPCGGTNHGKCEIDADKDCAWTLIYERLKALGQIETMKKYQRPRNYQKKVKPGKILLPAI